jgi:hypothetical protein
VADDDTDDMAYWRSPKTIGSTFVLLIVVVLLVWIVGTSGSGDQPSSQPGNAFAGNGSSAYDSACGLSGGSTQIPTDAPPTTWNNLNGWYHAVSEAHGPGKRTENGPWSCFARTPMGAVMAAYTIPMRIAMAENFTTVVQQQTVPGIGQTTLLAEGQPPMTASPAIALGFRVDAYTPSEATVSYYLSQNGAQYTCSMHVQWFGGSNGDWLLRPESNGDTYSGCVRGAPSRYVAWGPTP